ncbi:MAG TPA: Fic/DOC family N-terminal domain-containing protein [Propionicimonas sp.]|jgi:Fic family protein
MDLERFSHSPIGHLVRIHGTDGRTGRPYDHAAFVADPLSAEPALAPETWHDVNSANRALARLDQAARQIPRASLLRGPTLRREAQSTSALEGTFAPLDQVLAADRTSSEALPKEVAEVLNYVDAADWAFHAIGQQPRVTVGLLESAHKTLVRGTASDTRDAGKVRGSQVAIGSANGTIEDARFVPMPPGTELGAAAQDLVDWINATEAPREPLVGAAMAHYQFETLHPFNDGNGRVGRLLIVLHFMITKLISEPLLSVSPWFEARRANYQDHLAEVSATGDWNAWIRFFATGVRESADDTLERVNRLLALQQRYVALLQSANIKGLARDIAEALIGEPIVTVPRLVRIFGKTAPSTNQAVKKLVDLGILDEPIGTYNRAFVARDVFQALSAPIGGVPSADEPLSRRPETP